MPRPVAFSGPLKKQQLRDRRARKEARAEEAKRMAKANVKLKTRLTPPLFKYTVPDPFRHEDEIAAASPNQSNEAGRDISGRFVKTFNKEWKVGSTGAGGSGGGGRRAGVRETANHSTGTKLRSVFMKRSQMDIERSRVDSMKPLELLSESAVEVSFEEMFPNVIGFPKRPKWDYSMSREALEKNESDMFEEWMDSIYERYPAEELSYFEHNLEVWRQLWRVLENSDIIMIIVDIRHPVIHFPPSLYHYVVKEMQRKLVVVFNKVDLVAPSTLFAWKEYFKEQFPELHIASFSSYARDPALINDSSTAALRKMTKKPRRRYYNAMGVKDVLEACKDVELVKNGVQVEWDKLMSQYEEQAKKEQEDGENSEEGEDARDNDLRQSAGEKRRNLLESQQEQRKADALAANMQRMEMTEEGAAPHKDFVTIGLVGHPNVGKSSLINSIMGRTVVSTSRTPGHTKHFQTIFLTDNVRLCDSPGLVFPSLLPKPLQILSGMFPVAQVQEPYTVVEYLAQRVNLVKLLKLEQPPMFVWGPFKWSAYAICESFAIQRGFLTAKSGYPDVYRSANAILQMANDGRILLSFKPPGYFTSTKYELLRVAAADEAAAAAAEDEDEDEDEEEDWDIECEKPDKKKDRKKRSKKVDGVSGTEDDSTEDSELDYEDDEEEEEEEEEEEDEEEDEEEEEEVSKGGSKSKKFQVQSRVGGFFGLLQDEDGNDDDEEEDEDEDEGNKE